MTYRNDEPQSEMEMPETCPQCGAPNQTPEDPETGEIEWLCEAAEGFCSVKCYQDFRKAVDDEADAYAKQMQEEAEIYAKYQAM